MADKRISQLVDRGTIENNDVVPIVVSGASTTNKATISSIQTFMQENLDVGVTSVGLTMPSAFMVSNSPVTTSGNISVTGAGTVSQYIRGDGSLADFPQGGGGGGSSVNYYLNGSVSQGTIGGIAYVEMNKTPILGTGTDFTINADGYIASFITDAGDPALLEIPSGNWNFETYFQASSGGGTPTFYVELYKVNSGGTATLIASNSGTPELIAFGTTTTPYFSTLAVPTTTLTLTDRLALRYYVAHAGRTITLHTENATLCQIITTFTTGLTALNGLTAQVQNFTTGTSGTDFGISSTGSTHTFNLPTASATNRGALSSADWTTFNNKQAAGNYVTLDTTQTITGEKTFTATNTNINGSIVLKSSALTGLVVSSYSPNALEIGATISGTIYYSSFVFPAGARSWNLPNADGTIALTSDLSGYVTLGTTQTITGAKTFDTTTSTFALMNSTNANGGVLSFRRNGTNVGHIGNSAQLGGGVLDAIEVRSGIGSSVILRSDGGQVTLATGGGVTLTGALNGTSASFTGNVGIGTAASTSALTVNGQVNVINLGVQGFYQARLSDTAGNGVFGGNSFVIRNGSSSEDLCFDVFNRSSFVWYTPLRFTNSTGAATFSSSVTATGVITANGGGIDGTLGNAILFGNAGFPNTQANRIRSSNSASAAGNLLALEAGNGTIGSYNNNQLVLRGDGNVGIGTASPIDRTQINTAGSGAVDRALRLLNPNQNFADCTAELVFQGGYTSTYEGAATIRGGRASAGNDSYLSFFTNGGGTSVTERMRITSAGRLGIGTTSPTRMLDVVNDTATSQARFAASNENSASIVIENQQSAHNLALYSTGSTAFGVSGWGNSGVIESVTNVVYSAFNGRHLFQSGTSRTDRMVITSTGLVGIGNTSPSHQLEVQLPSGSNGQIIRMSRSAGAYSWGIGIDGANSNFNFYNNGSTSVANINNSTGVYTATSDERLKENIEDSTSAIDKLLDIKVRKYDWKDSEIKEDYGFVAQELFEVLPQYVSEGNEENYWGVAKAELVPFLIKAIQEQQEQINQLKNQMQ